MIQSDILLSTQEVGITSPGNNRSAVSSEQPKTSAQPTPKDNEQSFSKTLDKTIQKDIPKETTQPIEDTSTVENITNSTSLTQAIKEVKNYLADSNIPEELTEIIDDTGVANILFAVISDRPLTNISEELLDQIKTILPTEITDKIANLLETGNDLADTVDSLLYSAANSSVTEGEEQASKSSLFTNTQTTNDSSLVSGADNITQKTSITPNTEILPTVEKEIATLSENPDSTKKLTEVPSTNVIALNNENKAAAINTDQPVVKQGAVFIANEVSNHPVKPVITQEEAAIIPQNTHKTSSELLTNITPDTSIAEPEKGSIASNTQPLNTLDTTNKTSLATHDFTATGEAKTSAHLTENAAKQGNNVVNQTLTEQNQSLIKQALNNDGGNKIVEKTEVQTPILQVISEKAEIVQQKTAEHATSLAQKEAATVPDQIKISIARAISGQQNHISIQLDPAELGKVDVKLEWNKQGNTTVAIVVERQETYDLLNRDHKELAKALNNAGLNVDTGDLEFNLQQQQQDQQHQETPSSKDYAAYNQTMANEYQEEETYYIESLVAKLYDNTLYDSNQGVDIQI